MIHRSSINHLIQLPKFIFVHSRLLLQATLVLALLTGLLSVSSSGFAQPTQGSPRWVMQTRVQEALGGDPRFRDVRVTVTQPGTVILEGNVFDRKSFDAATQIASGVSGVTRVINALTTTSFDWKKVQLRINQTLLANGLGSVTATVIGNEVFLNGTVTSDADKQRAVAIAQSASGGMNLGSNIIRVLPSGLF
jgi:osmotically-inducible protein OsmY